MTDHARYANIRNQESVEPDWTEKPLTFLISVAIVTILGSFLTDWIADLAAQSLALEVMW